LYDALIGVRDRTGVTGVPSREDLSTLHRLAEESRLLFGKEITAYLEEWIQHAAASITAKGVLENRFSPHGQREEWAEKDHAAVTFFLRQHGAAITKRFKRYIGSL